jgi:hypothetical protein
MGNSNQSSFKPSPRTYNKIPEIPQILPTLSKKKKSMNRLNIISKLDKMARKVKDMKVGNNSMEVTMFGTEHVSTTEERKQKSNILKKNRCYFQS